MHTPMNFIWLNVYKNRVENNRYFFGNPALLSCEQGNLAENKIEIFLLWIKEPELKKNQSICILFLNITLLTI